jgi:hypothetical protein
MVSAPSTRRGLCIGALAAAGLAACAAPGRETQAVSTHEALTELELALRAYEHDSLVPLQFLLEPSFVGRANLLEAARKTLNEQKQIRVSLSEVKVAPGIGARSPTAISARWEKRFLRTPSQTPGVESGALSVVMRPSGKLWVIDAMGPDNPFVR